MGEQASTARSHDAAVLQIEHVTAGYGGRTVLRSLDLAVRAGELYALLGGNGAGKTTTLNLLLGFVAPTAGVVRVAGVDPVSHPAAARRLLGYIPERVVLYEHLTARENVAYLLDLAGEQGDRATIDAALAAAGLDRAAFDRRVGGFSKGMRQKVAIALAIARSVPALLLDEPTSGLDPRGSAGFGQLLATLRARGVAILMVTHDLLAAAEMADRIGFLASGRLTEEVAAAGAARFDVRDVYRRYAGDVA
ncbi:ABC-2 type transport system ATP-binding protein [Sphingomonas sp. BK235]|nr:ABC-2 type transport system ATP-binding protein [Sphingomonas sp. BK235]